MTLFSQRFRPVRDPSFANATALALFDRLRDIRREGFEHALWIGAGDASALKTLKDIGTLTIRETPTEGDIEYFPFDAASLDLIVANGGMSVINDLPGVLVQMRRALKPDGLFLCALPGGETLCELRDAALAADAARNAASPRVHPMIDLQTLAGLMQRAGFALPVVDAEKREVFYRHFMTLLYDIKRSGEGMALAERARPYAGKGYWDVVAGIYAERYGDGDLIRATFEVLYAIGWGPADGQQKPLKPGSAQNRLADALGTDETPLPR